MIAASLANMHMKMNKALKIIRKVFSDMPDSIADIVMERFNQYD